MSESHPSCSQKVWGNGNENENNELTPIQIQTGWRMCIDYRCLNAVTTRDHFSLPFLDQVLERVAGRAYYCFLDGYSGYITN